LTFARQVPHPDAVNSLALRVRRAYRKLRWSMLRGGPGRTARILTVPTANGLLSFSNMDLHNARALYVKRAWELDLLEATLEHLKREGSLERPAADVLVEAGANIGMIAIAMLRRGAFREALAIEPDPLNFELLERNIRQNGLEGRIRPVRCALAESTGEAELELSDSNFGDHRVRVASDRKALMGEEGRATVRVPLRSLDDVVESAGLQPERIGLVWIDVQGYEGHLFRGARRTLAGGSPVLTEFWPYGIQRSGMDRDAYAELARSLFDRMAVFDATSRHFEPRDLSAIGELFDRTHRPEEYLEILFSPRKRG
jgi:FkbM family methyltransferase